MSGALSGIIGVIFALIIACLLKPEWRKKFKDRAPSLDGFGGSIPIKPLIIWATVETLVLAIICRYWSISGNALWAWTKDWWLILVTAHVLVGFMVRKSGGHGGHSHGHSGGILETLKAFGSLGLIIAGILVFWQMGGCLGRMNNPDYASPVVASEPTPEPIPVRIGTWPITQAPGVWSEWIEYPRGYNTSWTNTDTVLVQRGKRVGREIVPSSNPPELNTPYQFIWVNQGEAVRISGWTNTATVIVNRRWQ